MSKHSTFKKIVLGTVAAGAAMYALNESIMKTSTAKDLLKKDQGKFFSFKYGDIFYKVSGKGKPVLLIHDLNECSSGMEWFYLEKKLSKKYKVYTLDLLGCGRSAKPKLKYNNFLYVQLISDFIREVVKEPVNIIATGLSAAPVIMATRLNEEWMDQLIFINPSDLVYLKQTETEVSKAKRRILTTPVLGTFIYHVLHSKDQLFNRFISDYFSNPNADFDEFQEYYYESCHKDRSGSQYLYASLAGNCVNMDIAHALRGLTKEMLIISGEDYYESDYVPGDYMKLNKNFEQISVLETSYLPQLEKPSKVMDVIEEFFD